jgi:hypothetical protein
MLLFSLRSIIRIKPVTFFERTYSTLKSSQIPQGFESCDVCDIVYVYNLSSYQIKIPIYNNSLLTYAKIKTKLSVAVCNKGQPLGHSHEAMRRVVELWSFEEMDTYFTSSHLSQLLMEARTEASVAEP